MLRDQIEKLIKLKGVKRFDKLPDYQAVVGHIRIDDSVTFTLMSQHDADEPKDWITLTSDPEKARERSELLTVYGCWELKADGELVETPFEHTGDTLHFQEASDDQIGGAVIKLITYLHSD